MRPVSRLESGRLSLEPPGRRHGLALHGSPLSLPRQDPDCARGRSAARPDFREPHTRQDLGGHPRRARGGLWPRSATPTTLHGGRRHLYYIRPRQSQAGVAFGFSQFQLRDSGLDRQSLPASFGYSRAVRPTLGKNAWYGGLDGDTPFRQLEGPRRADTSLYFLCMAEFDVCLSLAFRSPAWHFTLHWHQSG